MATSFKKGVTLDDKIDLSRIFGQLRAKWYWIILAMVLAGAVGAVVTRYSRAVFMANASVRVDDETASASDFLESYEMFDAGFSRYDRILTEGEIIKSRTNVRAALDRLPVDVTYIKVGSFSSYELYKRNPFVVNNMGDSLPAKLLFNVKVNAGDAFELSYEWNGVEHKANGNFGAVCEVNGIRLLLERTNNPRALAMEPKDKFAFRFNNKDRLVAKYRAGLDIVQAGPKVSLLNVVYRGNNALLVQEFVNALCDVYIEGDIENKSRAASKVLTFIDDQLDELGDQVEDARLRMAEFKQEHDIVDLETKSRVELDKLINLESQKRLLDLEMLSLESIKEQLGKGEELDNITLNVEGTADPGLVKLIGMLNELYIQRSSIGLNYTDASRRRQELDRQIAEVERSIRDNVDLALTKAERKITYFEQEMAAVQGSFKGIPEAERVYLRMLRDYEVNEKVVLYLMERRVAASISKASVVASARIIDDAVLPDKPVSMSKQLKLAIFLFMGFLLGLGFVLIRSYLDNRIYDRETIERYTDLPVLGVVVKAKKERDFDLITTKNNPRSVFNESINALRTNLQFIPVNKDTRVICTTSTVSQEGKSFTTINLAGSLSLLGKKVVIVDVDLRKPKVNKYFDADNAVGVSTHLTGQHSLDDIIRPSGAPGLDYIASGIIPPNPSELIQSAEFSQMVENLRARYDYVLIDTPPIGVVADALYVIKQSDIKLYISRAGVSRINFLKLPGQVAEEHNISNLYVVLNGFDRSTGSYYGGPYSSYYASGYYAEDAEESRPWWKFWAKS